MDLFDPAHRNPYLRADSLQDLCAFADLSFVRCAFVTILGRQPEPGGEAYYVEKLRSGGSKLAILRDLRRSPEGRSHDPGIAGFDKALRQHHNANRRFVGWIVRLVTGRPGSSVHERRYRALTNSIDYERELAGKRFALMHAYLVEIDSRLTRLQRQALAGQGASPRQVQAAEAQADDGWEAALNRTLS